MGLISKIKAAGATALGAIKSRIAPIISKVRSSPVAGQVIGAAKKVISSPGGKIAVAGAKFGVKRAGVIGLGITGAGLAYSGIKKLTKKKPTAAVKTGIQAGTAQTIKTAYQSPAKKLLTPSNIVKTITAAAVAGTAAYGAYKVYKAIKSRKKKKTKTRRRTSRTRRTRSTGRRVTFTTKSGKRVSFIPRSRSRISFSGRRKRKGFGPGLSKTEIQGIRRLIRSGERD